MTKAEAIDSIREQAERLPWPRAILVVSAHWIAQPVGITTGGNLETIHDFYGFPDALYDMQYPAQGDAELAAEIVHRLREAGISAEPHDARGLDHGPWVPLMLMYPQADVPVVQVSLPGESFDALVALGRALAPLRDQGVLIIGSGSSVHNLRALRKTGGAEPWALGFERWLHETVEGNRFDRLTTPEAYPPSFRHAHPTTEHFTPLVVAWAAADPERPGRRVHHSFSRGNLGMSLFEFGGPSGD